MSEFLFLAHRIPYPPNRGDKIRSWHVLKRLGELGKVHLACFADDETDAAYIGDLRTAMGGALGKAHVEVRTSERVKPALRALWRRKPILLSLFESRPMRGFIERTLASEDVTAVYGFSVQMAQYVPRRLRQRFVMDFVDVDSAKFAQYGRSWSLMGLVHRREARKLLGFERRVARRADASLFVSEAEAELFRTRARLRRPADIRVLGNGIDLAFYDPAADIAPLSPRVDNPLIVFTGQMDYRPNVEAVEEFARHILPLVHEARPDARFAIVGRNPTPAVERLRDLPGVTVTGGVEDIRAWLVAADVAVAPLGLARGVQNKVLEAMAMARPVVATPAAFEGIDAEPNRDLAVVSGRRRFATAVVSLINDKRLAVAMGAAARKRVEEAYSWDAALAPLPDIIVPGFGAVATSEAA